MNDELDEKSFKCRSCSKEATETINVTRFISNLDRFFLSNDLEGAKKYLDYWIAEAENIGDLRGFLSILNECIGFSRRIGGKEFALSCISKAENIMSNYKHHQISFAVVYTNIATTLNAFDEQEKALEMYQKAEDIYLEFNNTNTFEFASFLNNKSNALEALKRYEEAENLLHQAIEILKDDKEHDGEIGVSYINLAHLYYDRDSSSVPEVEKFLDLAWDFINSPNQKHDANFAYICSKCAPSFKYFKREIEAVALEETSKEIYGGQNESN